MTRAVTVAAACAVALLACSDDTKTPATSDVAADIDATDDADASPDAESPDADADAAPDVWTPPETQTVPAAWIGYDDGQQAGAIAYDKTPDAFYEVVRFELDEPSAPIRILGLRAQIEGTGSVTLAVWDDWGGNFVSLDASAPLASATQTVTAADVGQWVDFPLPQPVELVPGRMFYAGLVVTGDGAPQLGVDAAPSETPEDKPPRSLSWWSLEPPDEQGFPTIIGAPGDFLLQAEVERFDVMPEEGRDFEPIPEAELGIAGFSRVALADVDGDGDLDAMTNGPRLYLNDGAGVFTDATDAWLAGISGSNGGVFGDFDNDGDPDYFATGTADRLLENTGGAFADVTAAADLDDSQDFNCNGTEGVQNVPTEAAAWLDADGDGWLDLYQANFICWDPPAIPSRDILWRNRGDGTFEDATAALGFTKGQPQAGRGVAPADANGDGVVDVLVTNYRLHKNLYFESTPSGVFQGRGYDTTLEGDFVGGYYGHSIGAAWGDVDHDGDLDVFIANLAHPRFFDFSDKAALYLNGLSPGTTQPLFANVTAAIGLRYLETPSNPTFLDYDNDGDLDLFYTCIYAHRTSQLYRNDGHPVWTEITHRSGVAVFDGWGAAAGDIDGDGDLDLLARQSFRNRNLPGRGAVFVRLEGSGAGATNRDAIGARVEAVVGGRLVLRERFGGHGTGVQDSPWLHVGLGDAPTVDLTARFPASGTVIEVPGVPRMSTVHVREDGDVTITPL